jgi:hypothetical protein
MVEGSWTIPGSAAGQHDELISRPKRIAQAAGGAPRFSGFMQCQHTLAFSLFRQVLFHACGRIVFAFNLVLVTRPREHLSQNGQDRSRRLLTAARAIPGALAPWRLDHDLL